VVSDEWPPKKCEDCNANFCLLAAEKKVEVKCVLIARKGRITEEMKDAAVAEAKGKGVVWECRCVRKFENKEIREQLN
jgi:hypothetical protein